MGAARKVWHVECVTQFVCLVPIPVMACYGVDESWEPTVHGRFPTEEEAMRGDMPAEVMRVDGPSARGSVQAAVAASLNGSGYAALSLVECQVREGEVVLEGYVPSYHLKQLAQTFARRVAGVGRIVNQLAVTRPRDDMPLGQ